MLPKYSNNASTTVSGIHSAGVTSITVVDASSFPAIGAGEFFFLTIWNKTLYSDPSEDVGMEIVKVTAVNTDVLTIESPTVNEHADGETIALLLTDDFFGILQTDLDGKVNDDDSRLSDAREPLAHEHVEADITDFGSYVPTSEKNSANGIPVLDANSKVPLSQLPDVTKLQTYIVNDIAERDALTGLQSGEKCYILPSDPTNGGNTYIYDGSQWHTLSEADWENVNLDWTNITNPPATYTPSSHGDEAHSVDYATSGELTTHTGNQTNPHNVTKAQVGLADVINGAQILATQLVLSITDDDSVVPSAGAVVDYAVPLSSKGALNGVASLDENGDVPADQLDNAPQPTGDEMVTAINGSTSVIEDSKIAGSIARDSELSAHTGDVTNPHVVTAEQTGALSIDGGTMGGAIDMSFNDILGITSLSGAGGVLSMSNNRLSDVADPTNAQDAATKNYVDGKKEGIWTSIGGRASLDTAVDIDMNSKYLRGVLDPSLSQDAATKNYVDTQVANVAATSLLAANLETTITDDDTKVPSSGAVVDYVAANGGGIDINALTEKTNPVDADIIVIEDSADSYNQKKVQISNLPAGGSTTAYITRTLRFNGQLSVGTSYRTDALPYGATLDKVKLALFGSLPTGADINVQVTKNGVATTDSVFIADSPASILTSQSAESNGIYVTDGTLDSGMTSCSENDYFVVTITQVGSTYAGNDLDITLSFEV